MPEFRVFGPPGTGKTTYLAHQVERALAKHDPREVTVCSFTRAAAAEMAGRDTGLPKENIGTIHSLCYHATGCPPIAEANPELVDEWNSKVKEEWQIKRTQAESLDETPKNMGPLMVWSRARAALTPKLGFFAAAPFVKTWEKFKKDHDAVDFTDMLLRAPRSLGARVLFVDEAQDLTPLQWRIVRQWGAEAETFVVAGDDDQCQPSGTIIETTGGSKAIETLCADDRVLAYDRHGSRIYGVQRGYRFTRTARTYSGPLYTISAGGRKTRCTDGHWWLVRWTEEARQANWTAVYLMRKGRHFRVGWAQMFRSDGCTHLNVRANLEDADALWVLRVFNNKADACVYESICAARYGIPTITFAGRPRSYLTADNIQRVFSEVDSRTGAMRALHDHGLRLDRPLIDRRNPLYSRFGSTILKVAACNLIAGLMTVPVYAGDEKPEWKTLSVAVEPVKDLTVHSLDVEKHHTYIADGLVTHNCLYSFLGADAATFLEPLPEEQKRVLGHSYRLPRRVRDHADAWIKRLGSSRQPKAYAPRDTDGTLAYRPFHLTSPDALVREVSDHANDGHTVMILASCGYMLAPLIAELRSAGVPYHNPYRLKRGDWNPLRSIGGRILDFLACCRKTDQGTPPPAEYWWPWIEMLRSKDVLLPRTKAIMMRKRNAREGVTLSEIEALLGESPVIDAMIGQDVRWLQQHATKKFKRALEYPSALYSARGEKALRDRARVIIGTVHSVKGGQADVVYLFPDISVQAVQGLCTDPESRSALVRQFYVGMTRARETLFLCGPSSDRNFIRWN